MEMRGRISPKNGRIELLDVPNHPDVITDLETADTQFILVTEDKITIDCFYANQTEITQQGIIIATRR